MGYADVIIADTPASYWRLGEVASSTQINDEQARIAAGATSVSGATMGAAGLINGDADTCADFDGTNDFIVIDDTHPTSLTFELWIRPDVSPVNLGIMCLSSDNAPFGGAVSPALWIDGDGKVNVRIWDGSANVVTSSTVLAQNTIYHIAVTCADSGTLTLYINGASEGTPEGLGTMDKTAEFWILGADNHTDAYFNGKIDEFAVYHSVLTAQQIEDHYVAGTAGGGGGNRRRRFFMAAR